MLRLKQYYREHWIYFLAFLASLLLHLIKINWVSTLIFDEFHYVPAATEWLSLNPTRNLEHPPLGKYLIALSQLMFGISPYGSRVVPAIFGAGSVVMLMKAASFFGKSPRWLLCVGALAGSNIWIYVFSRSAMLDIFLLFFVLWQIVLFLSLLENPDSRRLQYLMSIATGLAMASKWSAIFVSIPLYLILFYHFKKLKKVSYFVFFSLLSVGIYDFCYLPYTWLNNGYYRSFSDIVFRLPSEMLLLQKSVGGTHGYLSQWWSWPLTLRPIWFTFEKVADGLLNQCILLIGNLPQMLLGIVTVFYLCRTAGKDKRLWGLLGVFFLSWLGWALSSRAVTFYYYFLIPGVLYSLLIPLAIKNYFKQHHHQSLHQWWVLYGVVYASLLFFIYFFPILSGMPIPIGEFQRWMWFKSWI